MISPAARGVVISPPIVLEGDGSLYLESSDLDNNLLRYYILFFDKINFPSNNVLHLGLSGDTQFLSDCGILEREEVRIPLSEPVGEPTAKAVKTAFERLNAREPGVWSLATDASSFNPVDALLDESVTALSVMLGKCLPVPTGDVAINDILEFKARRRDELIALRVHLDDVYQKILAAPDQPRAVETEVSRLDSAIKDYRRSMTLDAGMLNLFTTTAVANLLALTAGGVAVATQGWTPVGIAAGIGASIATKDSLGLARRPDTSPFKYVLSYERELPSIDG